MAVDALMKLGGGDQGERTVLVGGRGAVGVVNCRGEPEVWGGHPAELFAAGDVAGAGSELHQGLLRGARDFGADSVAGGGASDAYGV